MGSHELGMDMNTGREAHLGPAPPPSPRTHADDRGLGRHAVWCPEGPLGSSRDGGWRRTMYAHAYVHSAPHLCFERLRTCLPQAHGRSNARTV